MSTPLKVAVIGGGITGLTAAYTLKKAGTSVRLFEGGAKVGGPVQSEREGDWLVEAGPNSIQENSASLTALISELGLNSSRSAARPEAKNRYIFRNGKPQAAPASPPGLFSSSLFSMGAKLRIFRELLQRPRIRPADVSLADFVRSHFGDELVEYGLNPFVSGVYAGDPAQLSARHSFPSLWKIERETGSIIRGQIKAAREKRAAGESSGPPAIISFREGLGMLPAKLAEEIGPDDIGLNAPIKSLIPGERWGVVWNRDGKTQVEEFDRVLLALPAKPLAELTIGSLGERPLAQLANITYPAVSSLFLGYKRDQVAHPLDGFGVLMPQAEHRQVLGVLFSSSLFEGRAPAGHVGLTVMMGGIHRADLGQADEQTLLRVAQRELSEILGVTGDPVFRRLHSWPRAIPQYNLGYGQYLRAIEACETAHSGLLIGGHVRDGISLTNCIAAGQKLAERALS
ncbi:MAG: protoporphyrinogen oxidase [Opitutaceae bacterium]|jgi:protoporphyrinogen/coproporphyrinogen III oxidase|nr:protoporphyrinogen oxidase [Opitutaceae bacterium]